MSWNMESKMPFGKYKGEKLSSLDGNYVSWLCGEHWFKGSLKHFMVNNLYQFHRTTVTSSGDMMSGSLSEGYM